MQLLAYLAGKNCTGKFDERLPSDEEIIKFLDLNVNKLNHDSLLEQFDYTFRVEGVSRALTHQLVRHRVGVSFAQLSQRYTECLRHSNPLDDVVIPEAIEENDEAMVIFAGVLAACKQGYEDLRKLGIKKEDARAISPQCHTTDIIVKFNGRSLKHFLQLRLWGKGVQSEIKSLARIFYNLVKHNGNFFDEENC
jgi:thymidylate synthase (FAD)